jgi:hypothetical protein
MAKCKLCGKEVDKNTAFKLSTRTYCCSEDELNKHNELENLNAVFLSTSFPHNLHLAILLLQSR